MEVKYQTEQGGWLCFMHAVKRAFKGEHISAVAEDYDSEYDMRDTSCRDCWQELNLPVSNKVASSTAIDAVIAERKRQDAKWGQQNHDPQYWTGILMEEVGELAEAINETVFNNGPDERAKGGYANMRAEAVQVAAVAVAFVEMLDRRYGGPTS